MVRQDIVAGIRNALERGYSLEQAKTTMANSGYNQGDVLEAANYLTGGLGTQPEQHTTSTQPTQQPAQPTQQPAQPAQPARQPLQSTQPIQQSIQQTTMKKLLPTNPVEKPKKTSSMAMIVILLLILLALMGILALSFIFRDSLISFFEGLFG